MSSLVYNMNRRQSHNGVRLPRLGTGRRRTNSFPLVSDLENDTWSLEKAEPLPSITQGEQSTSVRNHTPNNTPKSSRNSSRQGTTPLPQYERNKQYKPLGRIPSKRSCMAKQTDRDGRSSSCDSCTQDDSVSQVLSMTRDTADSIVSMMRILHKQLHPDSEYTEVELGGHDSDVKTDITAQNLHKQPYKSILKSLRHCDENGNSHSVRIDQEKNITNIYDGVGGKLIANYNFSSEFNDVFSELVDP